MGVRRTTIELDESLAAQAVERTGATLRATVEEGLRLVIAQGEQSERRREERLRRHLRGVADGVDVDVLLSGDAWR